MGIGFSCYLSRLVAIKQQNNNLFIRVIWGIQWAHCRSGANKNAVHSVNIRIKHKIILPRWNNSAENNWSFKPDSVFGRLAIWCHAACLRLLFAILCRCLAFKLYKLCMLDNTKAIRQLNFMAHAFYLVGDVNLLGDYTGCVSSDVWK